MKKNLQNLTAALGLCVLLVGISTSVFSFTTAGTASSTSTSTNGTGGTQGSQPGFILVSGIDCSTSQVVYDPNTGAIKGYYKSVASYNACLTGLGNCSSGTPCISTDYIFIPK